MYSNIFMGSADKDMDIFGVEGIVLSITEAYTDFVF